MIREKSRCLKKGKKIARRNLRCESIEKEGYAPSSGS
jgi:hypothetical protein